MRRGSGPLIGRRVPATTDGGKTKVEIAELARISAPVRNLEIVGSGAPESDRVSSDRIEAVRNDPAADSIRSAAEQSGIVLSLSDRANALAGLRNAKAGAEDPPHRPASSGDPAVGAKDSSSDELTRQQELEVRELRRRDAEVRAHETAHQSAAGRHSRGGPKFEYEHGPDGHRYAVSGEVSIDNSPVSGDPDATIQKMQQVRRAALAPANPSAQDRKVAAQASREEAAARAEKLEAKDEARATDRAPRTLVDAYAPPPEEVRGRNLDRIA
ncbi:MAG: hypothetical protein CMJ84_12335 [Planctomycetes bacterium]|nr:hypothetical protein [Planctomycetota bacterium]